MSNPLLIGLVIILLLLVLWLLPYWSTRKVTPILKYADLDTLQEVVRALRRAGARATSCCSQHTHIGVAGFTPEQITNFAKIFYN